MTNTMNYKRSAYTPVLLFLSTIRLATAEQRAEDTREMSGSRLERIVAMWNKSSESFHRRAPPLDEGVEAFGGAAGDFPSELSKCLVERQQQITEDFAQGKRVIVECFKTTLLLHLLRYLGESPKSRITLLDGVVELRRVPGREGEGEGGWWSERREEYVGMYRRAMERLLREREGQRGWKGRSEEERAEQLNRIEEKSEAFLAEVVKGLGDERVERAEEEKLRREMSDPRVLSVVEMLSRNYMLKVRFYPGASARMMRSENGGFTFDVEIEDSEEAEEGSSDESSTRELRDGVERKDYFEEYNGDDDVRGKPRKGDKKKKKVLKKKAKALKKILPYLLLPIIIQMTLLPFVFKKLFFLAMKALLAGKVALILVGFNILRNTCIENDDFQKIRVEHYGYRHGEEYGAWVNGRALGAPSLGAALSEEPFRGHAPRGESA